MTLIITDILFAAGGFIAGALVFRNNSSLFNSLISKVQADAQALEARVSAVEAAVKKP